MKAVISSAGKTCVKYGFPPNSKPKCLFHFRGEVVLERQVKVLRECGINDIIVVVGYKKELIQKFNEEHKLGLKLVYNPTAESDTYGGGGWAKGLDSVRVGLQGVNDDVLIILGDSFLTKGGVKRVLEDKHRCVSLYSGHGWQLYKIPKELVPELRRLNKAGAMRALHNFCIANNGVKMVIKDSDSIYDIDYYVQTDEYKTVKAKI